MHGMNEVEQALTASAAGNGQRISLGRKLLKRFDDMGECRNDVSGIVYTEDPSVSIHTPITHLVGHWNQLGKGLLQGETYHRCTLLVSAGRQSQCLDGLLHGLYDELASISQRSIKIENYQFHFHSCLYDKGNDNFEYIINKLQ